MVDRAALRAADPPGVRRCPFRRQGHMQRCSEAAARDRFALARRATQPALRQRRLPDAENFGGEGSFEPSLPLQSLDPRVGTGEQCWRYVESKSIRCLDIYDELNFGRVLHRQVGGLLALENPPGIDRRLAVRIRQVGAITHEATSQDILPPGVDRRHPGTRRKRYYSFSLTVEKRFTGDKECISTRLRRRCESRFELVFGAGVEDLELEPHCSCCCESPLRFGR